MTPEPSDVPGPPWSDPSTSPVRRAYGPLSRMKNTDSFEAAVRFRIFGWSLVGALLGFGLGVNVVVRGGSVIMIPILTLVCWVGSIMLPMLLLAGGAKVGSLIYNPTGGTTPRKREHSYPQSLVARGSYEEAIGAYEGAIAEDPTDPTPYLQIARLARDKLSDDERAASWFRRGLLESQMHSGLAMLTLREFVELCETRLGEPRRAAPVLARMAAERPGTEEAEWAGETLTRIKEQMAAEPDEA